jgi:hypothetical protein
MPGGHIEVTEIAGDSARRPLVLLHEGLGSIGLCREFPEALAAATARRVITYSRFGHASRERTSPPTTTATMKRPPPGSTRMASTERAMRSGRSTRAIRVRG